MSIRDRVRRMLADIIHKGPEPWKPPPVAKQPPPPPAPNPLRIAAFGTLLALSERLKKTDRAGLASADAIKDARWSGREIARAVKALLEGEPEGTRGASGRRASDLLMSRWMAKQSAEPPPKTEEGAAPAPSRPLVEALYRLRRTLATTEQRDALRAVETVLYRGAAPDGGPPTDDPADKWIAWRGSPSDFVTDMRAVIPPGKLQFLKSCLGVEQPREDECPGAGFTASGEVMHDLACCRRHRPEAGGQRFSDHVAAVLAGRVTGGFRAKERADHKAWLRANADSVTVPEHPAVAPLRAAISFDFGERGDCYRREGMLTGDGGRAVVWEVRDAKGARWVADQATALREFGHDVASLAGSKPGERALSEVLAEARAAGYDEALQKAIAERNAMYSAHELGALADELDEDNYATAAKKLRAAIATIARLEVAAKEERAKGLAGALLDLLAGVHSPVDQAEPEAAMRVRTLLGSILAEERKRGHAAGRAEAFEACAQMVEQADGERWDAQGIPEAIRTRAQQ